MYKPRKSQEFRKERDSFTPRTRKGRSFENVGRRNSFDDERISKPFGKSRKGNSFGEERKDLPLDKVQKEPEAPKVIPTLEDIKRQLNAWVETEKIPGKMQAWFTADAVPEHSDWRIIKTYRDDHEFFTLEAPATEMEAPDVVKRIMEQLKKDHLHIFKKALRQIWFRADGTGRFALLMQINLKGRVSAHSYKTFVEFLERSCPEIISCHHIQCTPDALFDPASATAMRIDIRSAFGNDFLPIGNTGVEMHVMDWAPRIKDAWMQLPKRIESAIHPQQEDCFFEFYSGSSFVASALAPQFKRVDSMDVREFAMQSSRLNARNSIKDNMKFHRGHVEADFFNKFFNKSENEGRWTFYFNLPGNELLTGETEQAIASARPERILIQTGNLDIAGREIDHFRNEGYMLRKSIPLYLEPGSGKFEVLFLLVPDRVGILGQNPMAKFRSRNVQRPRERISDSETPRRSIFRQDTPTFKQRKG